MTFPEQFDRYRAQVEAALEAALPQRGELPQRRVIEAMRYSCLGGGKRIRGVCVLAFCDLFGGDAAGALPLAAAIEMVHAYSLIHDDLPCMDDDDLRRGKPSCHRAFDEATALLAGDALLTHAFLQLATAPLAPGRQAEAVRALAEAAGIFGMIGGQQIDIEGAAGDIESLRAMHGLKTGALFGASAALGCIAAGAGGDRRRAAETYMKSVGLAFQITDDILDLTGDSAFLGKPTGSDARGGKLTFPSLLSLEAAQAEAEELTESAVAALSPYGGERFFVPLARKLLERKL